jgi:hypothetical protein
MAALEPRDAASLGEYRRVVGGALQVMVGAGVPEAGRWTAQSTARVERGEDLVHCVVAQCPQNGAHLPLVVLKRRGPWNQTAVIWTSQHGKRGLFDDQGQPRPEVQSLLASGAAVIGLDLLGQGEHTSDGKPLKSAPMVNSDYAGYTFGYNRPLFAQRVQDILTAISLARNYRQPAQHVYLVGLDGTGPLVAAARAIAGNLVDKAAIDTTGFRFQTLEALDHPDFLPGIVKYGDLPALIALGSPHRVWVAGQPGQLPEVIRAAYRAEGSSERVTNWQGQADQSPSAAVQWLLSQP